MSESQPGLGDVLQAHIKGCHTCQSGIEMPPVSAGQKTHMCNEYVEIIQEYADFEGQAIYPKGFVKHYQLIHRKEA